MQTRKASATLLAVAGVLLWAGCGTTDTKGSGRSDNVENSEYPQEVFGNLSGSLVWYDMSGGAATDARNRYLFKDFTDLTGVGLEADFNPDISKFIATMENGGAIPWSLIEFGTKSDFLRAEREGLLQKLDTDVVPTDQLEEGSYSDYGIDFFRYGINLAYNTDAYPDPTTAPRSIEDLFDTDAFPGKRCMFQYPQFGATLESALLADGVTREELYPLDVDRALDKLDTIKDDIVWWSDGDEAIRLLTTGECDLGVAWSGRVYSAVTKDDAPLAITWNNALYSVATYGIPKGAPNGAAAQALLSMWIKDHEAQRGMVSAITYTSPITQLDEEGYGDELAPWIVAGDNVDAAIAQDEGYYLDNIDVIAESFDRWVASG